MGYPTAHCVLIGPPGSAVLPPQRSVVAGSTGIQAAPAGGFLSWAKINANHGSVAAFSSGRRTIGFAGIERAPLHNG